MSNQKKRSACESVAQNSLSLDLYRTPFLFLLPDSKEQYRSFLGTALSLLTYGLLFGFMSYRITVLMLLEEYKITHSIQEDHFDIFPGFS